MNTRQTLALAGVAFAATSAHAQLSIPWSTVDGGGATGLTGGTLTLSGTVGQPDVGVAVGGSFTLSGGFWAVGNAICYANCDGSSLPPVLNAGDFTCFLNRFRAANSLPAAQQVTDYANCDASTTPPVLNAGDFTCFLTRFRAGCP